MKGVNQRMTPAIVKCKYTVSIRRDVTDSELLEETIGEVKNGDKVYISDEVYWSWKDIPYYKVNYGTNPEEGFIVCDCVVINT